MKRTRLNPISKKPHRLAKRFVPKDVLAEVKKRSGGVCECWILWSHEYGPIPFNKKISACRVAEEYSPKHSGVERCIRQAMRQPHHILKRSRGGKHTTENLLDCCSSHHEWIESNDKTAILTGLSLPYAHYTP